MLLILCLLMGTSYQNGVVGINIDLPANSVVTGTNTQPPFCVISSGKSSIKWNLRIEKRANPTSLTPKEYVDSAIKSVQAPEGTVTLFDTGLPLEAPVGWWTVLHHTKQQNQSIIGRFAMPAKGKQMIMATLVTNAEGWRYGKDLFENTLLSIEPLDPVTLLHEKITALDTGSAFLASLSEESLHHLDGFREWRRIQAVENDGTKRDIGYAFVAVELGTMQDIEKTTRSENSAPTGIIVTFQTRLVPNLETGVVSDTNARYWMSWDGQDERWSSKMSRWVDDIRATTSETGIRNRPQLGAPKSKLLVVTQDLSTSLVEPPFKIDIQHPWLPRTLTWITGPLFSPATTSKQYRWWCYDTIESQKVLTRFDSLTVLPNEQFTLTTQFGEGSEGATTLFDHDGKLIKQTLQGNITITGSTQEAIKKIWGPRNL